MIKRKSLLTIFLLILFGTLMACGGPDPSPGDDILAPLPATADEGNATLPTLLERLSEDPNLVFFTNGLNDVGLADELHSGGPYTVFAASNLAFTQSQLVVSQMDPAVLGPVLDSHIVEGAYMKPALTEAGSVLALSGEQLPVMETESGLVVDYALIASEPLQASNGVLYVIDTLLLPSETGPEKSVWGVLKSDGRFTEFIAILAGTSVMLDLHFNNYYDAVLAPTDEAFDNMPPDIVSWVTEHPGDYHYIASFHLLAPNGWPQGVDLMVSDMVELENVQTRMPNSGSGFGFGYEELAVSQTDSGVTIGGAQIVEGDMDAMNGIVHAIDTVLIPKALLVHMTE